MSLQDLFSAVGVVIIDSGCIAGIVAALIQLSPIKVNPWSSLMKWIGKKLCGDIVAEMREQAKKDEQLAADIARIETKVLERCEIADQRAAIQCRLRILQFGDKILHGDKKHSKEIYDQILTDLTEYDYYCETHKDFKNEKTVLTAKRIREVYLELLETNGFL